MQGLGTVLFKFSTFFEYIVENCLYPLVIGLYFLSFFE